MAEKTRTVVRINNAEYAISSSAPEDYVRNISYYVDKKIQEISQGDRRLSTSMAAVLACVNIADELFQAKAESERLSAKTVELANDAGEARLALEKKSAECTKLTNENQALRINIARLETKLESPSRK